MNLRQVGILLIIIGVLMSIFVFMAKNKEAKFIDTIVHQNGGSCFVQSNSCLTNDEDFTLYYLGAVLSAIVVLFGVYLIFIDKAQKEIHQQHREVAYALKEVKEKDEFQAYIAGFSPEEQLVLKAIHEQEGIQQSTLRYRTGMPKTSLSLLLKSLEERGIISKKEHGKTNQLFLIKKF
ncbi:hypothetical protein HZA98_01075 [Candidatus Woesearchaeota archaeon]|nr:hypothetical protein [Candidatus Woesearchaeota archaeon]